MRAILLFLSLGSLVFAADIKTGDQWTKVKELKTGTEIRVYKKGAAQPLLAKAADATDEKLIVIVKNSQTAIDKSEIERVDARPQGGKRATVQSTATSEDPTSQPVNGVRPENYPRPGSSYSSNVSMGSKPDFETIYQRRTGAK